MFFKKSRHVRIT